MVKIHQAKVKRMKDIQWNLCKKKIRVSFSVSVPVCSGVSKLCSAHSAECNTRRYEKKSRRAECRVVEPRSAGLYSALLQGSSWRMEEPTLRVFFSLVLS